MNRAELHSLIDEILELEPGTVKGTEALADLENWDSLAVVGFIAAIHGQLDLTLEAKALRQCKTVDDLAALLGDKLVA